MRAVFCIQAVFILGLTVLVLQIEGAHRNYNFCANLKIVIINFLSLGVIVGFGETDYSATEGMRERAIVVQKREENTADVVLTLTPLLFSELPGQDTDGLDPAECKL